MYTCDDATEAGMGAPEREGLATLQAQAAMCACALHQLGDGYYQVCKWGMANELTCHRAVDDMLCQIGGSQ